jgi:hypothetical protein
MGIVKANYKGACDKCRAPIAEGDKCYVEKGKPRVCLKCAPPGAKEVKSWPSTKLDLPTEVALEAMKGILIRHPALKVEELAQLSWKASDGFMAQRVARGIK